MARCQFSKVLSGGRTVVWQEIIRQHAPLTGDEKVIWSEASTFAAPGITHHSSASLRFHPSPTNAFRTSDWEIPNCRAIRDGVTPALKAARTAFNFPCVKGTAIASTFLLREFSSETRSFLPRRFCSASTAASNRSSSWSPSCLIAFDRSAGRTCRDEVWVIAGDDDGRFADEEDGSRLNASENKSGVDDRVLISQSLPWLDSSDNSSVKYCFIPTV
jgi:hypothetical protein